MTACSNCGRELPQGALFCPDCGTSAVTFSVGQSGVSPSHFNTGMTATSPPNAPEDKAPYVPLASPYPEEKRRTSLTGRRGLLVAIIAILAVVLTGVLFEAGIPGSGEGPAVNSASTPLTGQQLYAAYSTNHSQADASYTNKTVYVQDSLDLGVVRDSTTGQYYSYVDSMAVVLYWNSQSQVGQLSQGATVLAKCFDSGVELSQDGGYLLLLQDCDLISVRSLSATTSVSISMNND